MCAQRKDKRGRASSTRRAQTDGIRTRGMSTCSTSATTPMETLYLARSIADGEGVWPGTVPRVTSGPDWRRGRVGKADRSRPSGPRQARQNRPRGTSRPDNVVTRRAPECPSGIPREGDRLRARPRLRQGHGAGPVGSTAGESRWHGRSELCGPKQCSGIGEVGTAAPRYSTRLGSSSTRWVRSSALRERRYRH